MTTIRAKRAAAAIAETKIREALEEIAKADEDERKRIPFSPIENLGGSHGQKRSEDAILGKRRTSTSNRFQARKDTWVRGNHRSLH